MLYKLRYIGPILHIFTISATCTGNKLIVLQIKILSFFLPFFFYYKEGLFYY